MEQANNQLEAIADAIEAASCPDREGPYGLYDYSGYPAPTSGKDRPHVIRDFRDPRSGTYGHCVEAFETACEAQECYNRLTREHIALAALNAVKASWVDPRPPLQPGQRDTIEGKKPSEPVVDFTALRRRKDAVDAFEDDSKDALDITPLQVLEAASARIEERDEDGERVNRVTVIIATEGRRPEFFRGGASSSSQTISDLEEIKFKLLAMSYDL